MVPAKGVETRKRPLGATSTTFPGLFPTLGVGARRFSKDIGAYGKEECKMSENQVVHHKTHYRKLLVR